MIKAVASGQWSVVSIKRHAGLSTWLKPSFYVLSLTILLLLTNVTYAQEEDRTYSLNLVDEDIKTVIKLLASESGKNFIIPEGVTGKVTLTLDKMKLNDALDVILKSHGLGYISEKGVIRIVKFSEVEVAGEELSIEVFTMNYARASDLVNQVKGVLSPKGTVSVDARTNSFIIKDTKKGTEDAVQLIGKLDSRTPQILIEARIIEANNNFSRNLGIQWGGKYSSSGDTITGGASLGTAPSGNNFAVNLPASGATSGIGMSVGSLSKNLVLDVQLAAAEKNGEIKIVSTPKVTTVNNRPAKVSGGETFYVKSTTSTTVGTTTALTSITAVTSLVVTPQVSADGNILLAVETSRDEPDFDKVVDGVPGIITKSASTTVLVKDGETTVIGGLYKNARRATETSVPFLSKIPVIGWFFKSKSKVEENEELLIFITPRIIKSQS